MHIGIMKEPSGETRVSLLPEAIAMLIGKGHSVFVEQGAGDLAFASDDEYTKAGAMVTNAESVIQSSEILLSIHPEPVSNARSKTLIGVYYPLVNTVSNQQFSSHKNTVFSLDMLPRTTREQIMDIVSPPANSAG